MKPDNKICRKCSHFKSGAMFLGSSGVYENYACYVAPNKIANTGFYYPQHIGQQIGEKWNPEESFEVPEECPYRLEHVLE